MGSQRPIHFPYGTNYIVYSDDEHETTVNDTDNIYYKDRLLGTLKQLIDAKNGSKNSNSDTINVSPIGDIKLPTLPNDYWYAIPSTSTTISKGGKKYKLKTKNKRRNKRKTKRNSKK